MKKLLVLLFLFGAFIVYFPQSATAYFIPHQERKIIVFRQEVSEEEQLSILSRHRATLNKKLKFINGTAVTLTSPDIKQLSRNPKVLRIDPDVKVYAFARRNSCDRYPWLPWCPQPSPSPSPSPSTSPSPSPSPSPLPSPTPTPSPSSTPNLTSNQPLPWGVARIQADKAWPASRGNDVKVAVLDTGIDRDHPDLKNNISGCVNFIYSWRTCEDDNGHGTHVSGVIAAEDNSFGVVGVAPKARIYSLKVLDNRGSGYLSDIIDALDWAVANKVQIVNMSLGTTSDIISFREVIERVDQAGIIMVAAAGNYGPSQNSLAYPARYPQVIAVSATDSNDNVSSWSSRGVELDLAAPGANIYSTYKRGGYATLSGTSFSAPHVAGTAALRLFLKPGETPVEIRNILKVNTEVISITDPTLVGNGLVNAYKVTTSP